MKILEQFEVKSSNPLRNLAILRKYCRERVCSVCKLFSGIRNPKCLLLFKNGNLTRICAEVPGAWHNLDEEVSYTEDKADAAIDWWLKTIHTDAYHEFDEYISEGHTYENIRTV